MMMMMMILLLLMIDKDDGVCQKLGLCGQGESSVCSTGLQSPSLWLTGPPSERKCTSATDSCLKGKQERADEK